MTITIIYYLLVINFLADQLIQAPIVTRGKHDSWFLMAAHVTTWSLTMLTVAIWMCVRTTHDLTPLSWWVLVSTCHFIVDFSLGQVINMLIRKKQFHHAVIFIILNTLIMNIVIAKLFFVIVIWS